MHLDHFSFKIICVCEFQGVLENGQTLTTVAFENFGDGRALKDLQFGRHDDEMYAMTDRKVELVSNH